MRLSAWPSRGSGQRPQMVLEAPPHRAAARQAARLEHRRLEVAALGDVARHQMELVGMALQGAHQLHGIAAFGEHAIERAVEHL